MTPKLGMCAPLPLWGVEGRLAKTLRGYSNVCEMKPALPRRKDQHWRGDLLIASIKALFTTSMLHISIAIAGTVLATAPAKPMYKDWPGTQKFALVATWVKIVAMEADAPAQRNRAGAATLSKSPSGEALLSKLT
eukprot:CAMPEP_0115252818 /NCGR_PEP_ID=MMETSP0270-20121206/44346_1 /TAXON_ID=71861 /ORGANISM="Scrippsiella trochoidea, Strain CCMP3099" /LENGTH=134 /DNA_ID=CAMNT_0002668291 /DNA_START=325 /DNA_END=731 /DNA_ORIENTATION=+